MHVLCLLLNYNNPYRLNQCLRNRLASLWLCHNELAILFGLQLHLWMVFLHSSNKVRDNQLIEFLCDAFSCLLYTVFYTANNLFKILPHRLDFDLLKHQLQQL